MDVRYSKRYLDVLSESRFIHFSTQSSRAFHYSSMFVHFLRTMNVHNLMVARVQTVKKKINERYYGTFSIFTVEF